jgi:hypothetical protein
MLSAAICMTEKTFNEKKYELGHTPSYSLRPSCSHMHKGVCHVTAIPQILAGCSFALSSSTLPIRVDARCDKQASVVPHVPCRGCGYPVTRTTILESANHKSTRLSLYLFISVSDDQSMYLARLNADIHKGSSERNARCAMRQILDEISISAVRTAATPSTPKECSRAAAPHGDLPEFRKS